ncbi:MAG: invasion associated locus B family protein [Pseudomonadota bacterium]
MTVRNFQRASARVALGAVAGAVVALASFTAAPAIVAAQENANAGGAAPAPLPKRNWYKICPVRKGADGKDTRICVTQQEQFNQRSGELNVAVAVRKQESKKDKLLITVPLGVALPSGVAVKFDKIEQPLKFTYVFCHAEGCVIDTEATPQIVDAMKAGANMNISVFHTFYNAPVRFDVPLKDFTAALDGEPVDGNLYFRTRRGVRLAIRKRTADLIKKQREEAEKTKTQQ